jgi:hypothetical protein
MNWMEGLGPPAELAVRYHHRTVDDAYGAHAPQQRSSRKKVTPT